MLMSTVGENFVELPVGFKFLPTDEQLLGHFLYNKVVGALHPVDALFVKEIDIYGEKEPWRIWDEYGGPRVESQGCKDLYFFTQLKAKHGKGSRKSRTVCGGRGTWDGENAPTDVYSRLNKGLLLGSKKRFSYDIKSSGGDDGSKWIMVEYSLNPELLLLPSSGLNNFALCVLRKLLSKKRKPVQKCNRIIHQDRSAK